MVAESNPGSNGGELRERLVDLVRDAMTWTTIYYYDYYGHAKSKNVVVTFAKLSHGCRTSFSVHTPLYNWISSWNVNDCRHIMILNYIDTTLLLIFATDYVVCKIIFCTVIDFHSLLIQNVFFTTPFYRTSIYLGSCMTLCWNASTVCSFVSHS